MATQTTAPTPEAQPRELPAGSQSLQIRMKDALGRSGIPSLDINCYGSQVVITAKGYETARKWAALLARFCRTVSGPRESWEERKEDAGKFRPRHYKVWRVWGTV